jgi:uncharacterized protein (DUF427 family)
MAHAQEPHNSIAAFRPPAPSVEPTPRWVRVRFGGVVVADSR